MEDTEQKKQEPKVDKNGSDSCSGTTPYPSTKGKTMQQIDHDAWQWAVDNGLL